MSWLHGYFTSTHHRAGLILNPSQDICPWDPHTVRTRWIVLAYFIDKKTEVHKAGARGRSKIILPMSSRQQGSTVEVFKLIPGTWCGIECPRGLVKNTGESGCSTEEFPYLLGIPPETLLVSMLWLNKRALCHDGPEAKVEKGTYQPTQAERARARLSAGCTKQGTVWSQRYAEARVSIINPRLVPQTGLWEHRPWLSFYSQVRNLDVVHSYSWAPVSWSRTFSYT